MITTTSPLQGNLPLKYYCFSGLRQVWWPAQELSIEFWTNFLNPDELVRDTVVSGHKLPISEEPPESFQMNNLSALNDMECVCKEMSQLLILQCGLPWGKASWFLGHWDAWVAVILDLSRTHVSGRVHLGDVLSLMWLLYSSPLTSAAWTASPGMYLIQMCGMGLRDRVYFCVKPYWNNF